MQTYIDRDIQNKQKKADEYFEQAVQLGIFTYLKNEVVSEFQMRSKSEPETRMLLIRDVVTNSLKFYLNIYHEIPRLKISKDLVRWW